MDFVEVRARLQTPSPRGRRALDMFPEEVMDLVKISQPPPFCPRPYYYRHVQLGEEIMGDLRKQLDTMRMENRFRKSQTRQNPIIAHVPILRPNVRPPVSRGDVSVQGKRIMDILAS